MQNVRFVFLLPELWQQSILNIGRKFANQYGEQLEFVVDNEHHPHITLGDVDAEDERVESAISAMHLLSRSLHEVAARTVDVGVGLGWVWIRVSQLPLYAMKQWVCSALSEFGTVRTPVLYDPHITLTRVKGWADEQRAPSKNQVDHMIRLAELATLNREGSDNLKVACALRTVAVGISGPHGTITDLRWRYDLLQNHGLPRLN